MVFPSGYERKRRDSAFVRLATHRDVRPGEIEELQLRYARRGLVLFCAVFHDDDCPCSDGQRLMTDCICEVVDVQVHEFVG